MAGKTLIGGTEYTIKGGKALIGGTGYSISNGKTLIGGTSEDIVFDTNTYLYNYGDECSSVTSGWHGSGTGSYTNTKNSNNLYTTVPRSGSGGVWSTNSKVNLSNFSILKITVNSTFPYSGVNVFFVGSTYISGWTTDIVEEVQVRTSGLSTVTLDITGISGSYYVGLATQSYNTSYIYQVWLE